MYRWDRRFDRNCFVHFVIRFPAVRCHSIKIIQTQRDEIVSRKRFWFASFQWVCAPLNRYHDSEQWQMGIVLLQRRRLHDTQFAVECFGIFSLLVLPMLFAAVIISEWVSEWMNDWIDAHVSNSMHMFQDELCVCAAAADRPNYQTTEACKHKCDFQNNEQIIYDAYVWRHIRPPLLLTLAFLSLSTHSASLKWDKIDRETVFLFSGHRPNTQR